MRTNIFAFAALSCILVFLAVSTFFLDRRAEAKARSGQLAFATPKGCRPDSFLSDYNVGKGFSDICGLAWETEKCNRAFLYNDTCSTTPLQQSIKGGVIYHVCECSFYNNPDCASPLNPPDVEQTVKDRELFALEAKKDDVRWYRCYKPPGT